jgi:hypothetical protein
VGPLEPRTAAARVLGAALYLAAVGAFVVFQEIGLQLRREERRAWWASTGRDLLNLAGLAGIALALVELGFPLPAAVASAGTLTLVLFGTSIWLETRPWRGRRWLALAAGALVSLPLVLFPSPILAGLGVVVERLFGPQAR